MNIRSVSSKISILEYFVTSHPCQLIALTETWACPSTIDSTLLSLDSRFSVHRSDRTDVIGGGVVLLVSPSIPSHTLSSLSFSPFCQLLTVSLSLPLFPSLTVFLVYRSPRCLPPHFSDCLEYIANTIFSSSSPYIILGDFNAPDLTWPTPSSHNLSISSKLLHTFSESFSLTQHVLSPTRGDNILDLVFSSDSSLITATSVTPPLPSCDHCVVLFQLNSTFSSSSSAHPFLDFRKGNYEAIQSAIISQDWTSILLCSPDPDVVYSSFLDVIHSIISVYVPLAPPSTHSSSPYETPTIRSLRAHCDSLYSQRHSRGLSPFLCAQRKLHKALDSRRRAHRHKIAFRWRHFRFERCGMRRFFAVFR